MILRNAGCNDKGKQQLIYNIIQLSENVLQCLFRALKLQDTLRIKITETFFPHSLVVPLLQTVYKFLRAVHLVVTILVETGAKRSKQTQITLLWKLNRGTEVIPCISLSLHEI